MADPKAVAGGIGIAAAIGVGLAVAFSGSNAPPTCEHVSDPKACAEFLKIKNPTPAQVRLYEDSH